MIPEILITYATSKLTAYIGGSILFVLVTWILKKIPTAEIRKAIYDFVFKIFAGISKAMNKWKVTKPIWESLLEPWLINFLDMFVMSILYGIFDGLRSDNDPKSEHPPTIHDEPVTKPE